MPQYVALQPITAGDVLAYSAGDPVHPDNVAANGYEVGVQVAERDSEQAVAALRALGMLPAEEGSEEDTADDPAAPPAGAFDPAGRTIAEVNEYLARHPDDATRVLAAEQQGKHRAGIVHGPHGEPPDIAEA